MTDRGGLLPFGPKSIPSAGTPLPFDKLEEKAGSLPSQGRRVNLLPGADWRVSGVGYRKLPLVHREDFWRLTTTDLTPP